jgi:AraC family transcriptional regulator, transcriptional activator of pobA
MVIWPMDDDCTHAHDFLVLVFVEQAGGAFRVGAQHRQLEAGDLYVIAPAEVIGVGDDAHGLTTAAIWGVFFPPEVVTTETSSALLAWRARPLLFPFVRGVAGGAQRLTVPLEERSLWSRRFAALDRELLQRRDGDHAAALAYLTLILVDVGRLPADVVGDLKLRGEPLLASVFDVIETRNHEPISLKDVAWG